MSRIGKQPVEVPDKVHVTVSDQTVRTKGPNGELSLDVHPEISVALEDGEVRVGRPSDSARHKALHGLTRSLIANMVEGVTDGFQKTLEIHGVGYRAQTSGQGIRINLGFSHPVDYKAPKGITLECPDQTTIVISGADKQLVGQTAAEIRALRPPEPYKGKGVRYQGEAIRRKAGKAGGK